MTISVGGIWKSDFVFPLLPVALDKIDVLEAKLRDTQEEIEQLKSSKPTMAQISLASTTACNPQQIIQWNEAGRLAPPAEGFIVSADHRQVTVLKPGVYQVNVRVGGISCDRGQRLVLVVNGTNVATCHTTDG
ncbi:hypothetical protein EON65_46035 [archaeon]|nr:MAG: hypothetical protein EON65_46035 [archaeon]